MVAYYVVLPDNSRVVQSRFYSAKEKPTADAAARALLRQLSREDFQNIQWKETIDWPKIVRNKSEELQIKVEVEFTPKNTEKSPGTCRVFIDSVPTKETFQTYGIGMTNKEAEYVAFQRMADELGLRTEESSELFKPNFFDKRL